MIFKSTYLWCIYIGVCSRNRNNFQWIRDVCYKCCVQNNTISLYFIWSTNVSLYTDPVTRNKSRYLYYCCCCLLLITLSLSILSLLLLISIHWYVTIYFGLFSSKLLAKMIVTHNFGDNTCLILLVKSERRDTFIWIRTEDNIYNLCLHQKLTYEKNLE